jgi:hypothetical protein
LGPTKKTQRNTATRARLGHACGGSGGGSRAVCGSGGLPPLGLHRVPRGAGGSGLAQAASAAPRRPHSSCTCLRRGGLTQAAPACVGSGRPPPPPDVAGGDAPGPCAGDGAGLVDGGDVGLAELAGSPAWSLPPVLTSSAVDTDSCFDHLRPVRWCFCGGWRVCGASRQLVGRAVDSRRSYCGGEIRERP